MNEEIANLSDLAALLALFGEGEKGDPKQRPSLESERMVHII